MEEQTDTQEAQQTQEMGVVQRMVGVFFSPGETFASVNRLASHKDWLIPLLLLILVGQVTLQFTMPLIKEMSITQVRKQMEKNENLSEEQREKAVQNIEKFVGISTRATVPFAVIAFVLIGAAILLALSNLILGGEGTYKKILAVMSYSSLVGIPGAIVGVPLMLAKESVKVQVGFGLLVPGSMSDSFLFHFLNNLNFFYIWQCGLISIGLGAVAGIEVKKAAWWIFTLLVLLALGLGALGMLGS